ncbi:MAG: hypothetical protein Sapg2KO_08410 [Saprospiraceae bacterium]
MTNNKDNPMKYLFSLLFISVLSLQVGAQKSNPAIAVDKINPLLLLNQPNQVVRQATTTFRVNNLKSGELHVRQIITILNSQSDANQLYLTYDQDSRIKNLDALLYDEQGNLIRKIEKEEYKDNARVDGFSLYQDNRIKYVEISHSSYPYTIVWEYTKELKGIDYALFPDWHPQSYGEAVEKSSFSITVNDDQKLLTKALNLEVQPNISSEGKNTTSTWEVENLIAIHAEKASPSSYYILPKLLTASSKFQIDSYEGSMSSWEDYGLFMKDLFETRDQLPKEVIMEVQTLTAKATSNQEKIDLLYGYLKDKMRYVSVQLGIGGWQPFSAAYVAENNYGDCKALSNYMMSLLKVVGIKSYPVLIANGDLYYEITEDFTTFAFNHMILYVPEEDIWLECTSSNYPVNYIGSGNYNRKVVLVTEKGGKVVRTPTQTKADNKETIHAKIKIEADGSAKVQYRSMLAGKQHELFRYISSSLSEEDQKEWILKRLDIPNFNLDNFSIKAEGTIPCAEYDYSGASSKYTSTSGSRMFIPINKISAYLGVPDKDDNRVHQIVTKQDYQEELNIEIELPETWVPESVPAAEKTIETPFGSYLMTCERDGNRILIKRHIQFNRYTGDAESYADYRKFYRSVNRAEKSQVVVRL